MKKIVLSLFALLNICVNAQWQLQNPIPTASITYVRIVDPTVIVAVDFFYGYISSSTDRGETWINSQAAKPIPSNIPHPNRLKDLALLTDKKWIGVLDTSITITEDGGKSWSAKQLGNNGLGRIFFADENNGVVLTYDSTIYKTTNGGTDWKCINVGDTIVYISFVSSSEMFGLKSFRNPKGLHRGTAILFSTDLGETFSQIFVDSTHTIITFEFLDNQKGMLAFDSPTRKILTTSNGGNKWDTLSSLMPDQFFRLKKLNSSTLGKMTSTTLFKSTDLGISWDTLASLENPGSYLSDFSFSPSGFGSVVGSRNVLVTTDWGESWNERSQPYGKEDLFSVAFIDSSRGVTVGRHGSILYTTNGGTKWLNGESGITDSLYKVVVNENIFWCCGTNGTILKSTDLGATWSKSITNVSEELRSLYFSDAFRGAAVGLNGICIITTDGGITWEQINTGATKDLSGVSFFNKNEGVAVGDGAILLRTSNGGKTWRIIFDYDNEGNMWLSDVFVVANTSTAYAVGATGTMGETCMILKTTDKGETWRGVSPNQYSMTSNVFFTDELNGYVLESYRSALLSTTDGGTTWVGDRNIGGNAIAVKGNNAWLVRNGGQILKTNSFITAVDEEKLQAVVSDFSLEQNYPNPFNPETVISYQLPVSSKVSLKVYDILGNEIATLVNEEQQPGSYEVVFNTQLTANNAQLASGVYFYCLQAGNFVHTKKFILMK